MIQYLFIILILIGIYGMLTERNLLKILISLNVLDVGLNLFIISIGYVKGGVAPIFTKVFNNNMIKFVDPLPQALVLTSIVIGVGVTAVGLAFAKNIYAKYGTFDLDEMEVKDDE
ncbi:sodium:proton antiporter [Haliovirga abyssi]|uniref:Cation:proton antiporter n=1 Tax=Haliovirga abyssi TaxID=2996794 RepID=A0AAU9E2U3_9FUSO|nr:sodium:proton antiporter [Haliovirga abyssi]BDU50730.1 cation:proton antiporter [Haliovirga abyssi]